MKIQYCSDLHLELPENRKFMERHPLEPVGEVLLLAGDILPFSLHKTQTNFIDWVADNFEMVYWIPGNHEYYQYDINTIADPLLEKIRSNVWLVNNQLIPYKNVNFLCSTLWSRISPVNALDIQRCISDFFSIQNRGEKFTTSQFNQLHENCISFLQKAITENAAAKNIVITHHIPTLLNYPAKYRSNPLNEAFAVELFDFIQDSNVASWIYGHHHTNVDAFTIGKTTMLTNQLGYIHHREHKAFKPNAMIEIND